MEINCIFCLIFKKPISSTTLKGSKFILLNGITKTAVFTKIIF